MCTPSLVDRHGKLIHIWGYLLIGMANLKGGQSGANNEDTNTHFETVPELIPLILNYILYF
jgi:hypothetical protein